MNRREALAQMAAFFGLTQIPVPTNTDKFLQAAELEAGCPISAGMHLRPTFESRVKDALAARGMSLPEPGILAFAKEIREVYSEKIDKILDEVKEFEDFDESVVCDKLSYVDDKVWRLVGGFINEKKARYIKNGGASIEGFPVSLCEPISIKENRPELTDFETV